MNDRFELIVLRSAIEHWLRVYEICQLPVVGSSVKGMSLSCIQNSEVYYLMSLLSVYDEWPDYRLCSCCMYASDENMRMTNCDICPLKISVGVTCHKYYHNFINMSHSRSELLANCWSMIMYIYSAIDEYENKRCKH